MDPKEIRTGRVYNHMWLGVVRDDILCSQITNKRKDPVTDTRVADIELLIRERDAAVGVYRVSSQHLQSSSQGALSIHGGCFRIVEKGNREYARLDFLLRRKGL